MAYQDIFKMIEEIEISCEEDLTQIDELLDSFGIYYTSELDCAYESCGYDVYYYAYAFVYEGVVRLITGTYDIC